MVRRCYVRGSPRRERKVYYFGGGFITMTLNLYSRVTAFDNDNSRHYIVSSKFDKIWQVSTKIDTDEMWQTLANNAMIKEKFDKYWQMSIEIDKYYQIDTFNKY